MMSGRPLLPKFGVWVFPAAGALALVDAVVRADRAGVDELWLADEGVMREPSVVLAAAAAQTARIRLGVGITSPMLRHPGASAATWLTLDELSDGRAMLGFGLGGELSLAPFHLTVERPVAVMRNAICTARAVITRTESEQYVVMPHAAPARNVPIFVASKGEQINRLASREADGVLLSGFRLGDLAQPVRWARSVRAVHVALYASARYRVDAPTDPTSLVGTPAQVADGLVALACEHRPESIGVALVDGDAIDVMMGRAIETMTIFRERWQSTGD